MIKENHTCEIFCDVIDNYGDAGFAWRLACELIDRFNFKVRFWIKSPEIIVKFFPEIKDKENPEILIWDDNFKPCNDFYNIVIACFSCNIPYSQIESMENRLNKPIWINVEYLSAEKWVDEFHGKCSLYSSSKLKKFFYFPGFSKFTGGLLRERVISDYSKFGTNKEKLYLQEKFNYFKNDKIFSVFIFGYKNLSIKTLISTWINGLNPVRLFIIEHDIYEDIFDLKYKSYGSYQYGNLEVVLLPFLSHHDFDILLRITDFNIVRGEDSLVRALWSMKPFLWDIYKQENEIHLNKLRSFNNVMTFKWPKKDAELYSNLSEKWNNGKFTEQDWFILIENIKNFKYYMNRYVNDLRTQDDMVTSLMKFYYSVV